MGLIYPRRACYVDSWGYPSDCRSSWNEWGRWVAFAVIVGCAFIIFFLFACYNARRRRRAGLRPRPGTAWMAGPPPPYPGGNGNNQQQQPYYPADPYYQQPPPPQYTPQPPAYGYFGGQQTGIEMQRPQNTYQADGGPVYPAPPGPPPNGAKA